MNAFTTRMYENQGVVAERRLFVRWDSDTREWHIACHDCKQSVLRVTRHGLVTWTVDQLLSLFTAHCAQCHREVLDVG